MRRMSEHFSAGNGGRQQAARGGQKLPPANGGVLGLFLHARLLGKRSNGVSTNVSDALYVTVTLKQEVKIVFLVNLCGSRKAEGPRQRYSPAEQTGVEKQQRRQNYSWRTAAMGSMHMARRVGT
jgi:hypothetical protein